MQCLTSLNDLYAITSRRRTRYNEKDRDIPERAGGGARILVLGLQRLRSPPWHLAIWIVLVTFHSFETSVCGKELVGTWGWKRHKVILSIAY